ncbi:hypothetical protein [Avibacterium paragallinarum]|uniref:Uncharacterized protein n=1 Tax=Avibacterium paragallinarum TaxID=728 RepID=A0A377IWD7_AVIPA|nr:hypothetical protein [Avibacterium paragallinarum]POY47773.1 hypothetical protein C3364_00365 [Avibacterium paragallinarum]RZN75524.1 hypothetical protein EC523_08060 [Avibacterium paragallinarum]CDG00363.1 Putative uncharacterized protein [Avibacterium paragallinarum JF4211]STO91940.1 Uncharacterised protein [Avibacterium paragallinarum]
MKDYTNLICYEIATRIESENPQSIVPYLSPELDFKTDQDAPHLLYVVRKLFFKEGTDDTAYMRKMERLYIERIIKRHQLSASVETVEVEHSETIPFPTRFIAKYNPVCFSFYKSEEDANEDA